MATLSDVYKKVCELTQERISADTARKRYGEYFDKIVKTLGIEDAVEKYLKKNNRYQFSEKGVELLAEVFDLYYLSLNSGAKKARKEKLDSEDETTDNSPTRDYVARILADRQYNAFIPEEIIDTYKKMVEANGIVLKIIKCFYQLFLDVGVEEEEVKKILHISGVKYNYAERQALQETIEMMGCYVDTILKETKQQRELATNITKTENALWINYATKAIECTMNDVVWTRLFMREIRQNQIVDQFGISSTNEDAEIKLFNQEAEEVIKKKCSEDETIINAVNTYNRYAQKKLELNEVIERLFAWCEGKVSDSELNEEVLREIMEVPRDGKTVWRKLQEKHMTESLEQLKEKITEVMKAHRKKEFEEMDTTMFIRNKRLLSCAIAKSECKKADKREWNNRLIERAKFQYSDARLDDIKNCLETHVDVDDLFELLECDYIEEKRNIVIQGVAGSGKTYISNALGIAACQKNYGVYYIRLTEYFKELEDDMENSRKGEEITFLCKTMNLLIMDDFLDKPLTSKQVKQLSDILDFRKFYGATIVCSRLHTNEWLGEMEDNEYGKKVIQQICKDSHQIQIQGMITKNTYVDNELESRLDRWNAELIQ